MAINVLCLHGCNQTQEMFQRLMKNYIRLGEKQYNLKFHFTEAKYDHPLGGKTWYNKPLNVSDIGSIEYNEKLVSDILDDIAILIEENNINVLLGFSQGANVVDTFLTYRPGLVERAIIMSGYSLVDPDRKISNTPVMIVSSEQDTVVPCKLNPQYEKTSTLVHDKGHKLPTRNTQIREICTFARGINL